MEALTVMLAAGTVFGWRSALAGVGAAVLALSLAVALLGPAFARIPATVVHLGFGLLLLAFRVRWLLKAVKRAAGVLPKRDETAAYARQSSRLRTLQAGSSSLDRTGMTAAFQITIVEGGEVIFIVLAIGAGGSPLLAAAMASPARRTTVSARSG